MEMTYAALAKSLGLTLKSSSSSASTTSSAGKDLAVASTPTPASASAPISPSKLQTPPPVQLIVTREEENKPEESETEKEEKIEEKRDEASSGTSPISPRLSGKPETKETDNGKVAAAGDAESDIASSRRSSPSPIPAAALEGSSQEENSIESQSTNPSSVSQGMDVDASNGAASDVTSDKPVFFAPLVVADKDSTSPLQFEPFLFFFSSLSIM